MNQLTLHFTLEEFTRSATASRLGICNEPSADSISNMQNLCQEILEPLRAYACQPIIITSGYRCRRLNKAVGGVSRSQHCTGEAADIHLPDMDTGQKWFAYIKDHLRFDQLIWEHSGGATWIHVSLRRQWSANRYQVLCIMGRLH